MISKIPSCRDKSDTPAFLTEHFTMPESLKTPINVFELHNICFCDSKIELTNVWSGIEPANIAASPTDLLLVARMPSERKLSKLSLGSNFRKCMSS